MLKEKIKNNKISILIVDDSSINLQILSTVLSREGYEVLSAQNGALARELATEHKPDLILLDIMMPEEDGFSVMRSLKNNTGTTSIPVIFLTGVSEIESKIEGFNLGAVDYIIKPFHPMEVLARVRLHLKLSIATNSLIASQAQTLKQIQKAQDSLFVTPESLKEARFGVFYKALNEAGGDFYDVISISEDIYAYFLADFSGHDISTSYLNYAIKALLRQNCLPIYQANESIKLINDVLLEVLPREKYLTASYAHLNRKTMKLTLVSAAHPPAVYVPHQGRAELIELSGDVLGIFRDVVFEKQTISIGLKDRIYLYSDGLIENKQKASVWTRSKDKILNACEKARDFDIGIAAGKIKDMLLPCETDINDDIVILAIEV